MADRPHVFLTGASSGIGESMARAWLAAGAAVTLLARRESPLLALASTAPERSHVIVADLSQDFSPGALFDEAEQALGPCDVLVNNAGVQIVEPAHETSWERGAAVLTVDLLAPLRLTQEALRRMIPRRRGTIVDIASMAALAPTPGMFFYNAAKGGLAGASEGLCVEARRHGVHVVTVYPGPVTSAMEAAGRAAFEPSTAVSLTPTGNSDSLARLVMAAVERRRARVIYPRSYALARMFPGLTRWFTDRLTPPLKQLPP
ncbi:MAG: SDR family NAD(P)-dependent oxidoreductase [Myxococcales bacterium]|nr:SDR family NAD(P)-dependent oxidoreductase [Myxococcales bacterium]